MTTVLVYNAVVLQTKVQLIKNGVDISDHKVLDTYKKIYEVFGLDFEVFSQLTYQSSTDLLEFLKATDANRKKVLNQSIQSRKVYCNWRKGKN